MRKQILFCALVCFLSIRVWGETSLEEGIKAFRLSENDKAELLFTQALESNPADDTPLLYLGLLYQNMGHSQKAEEVMKRGISIHGSHREQIQLNLANFYFSHNQNDLAEETYRQIIRQKGEYPPSAQLNLANLFLNSEDYPSALNEYGHYLILEPESPQGDKVRELMTLLTEKIAYDKEQARLAELRRQEEERRRAEEEARRKALMEDILGDLNNAGEATQNYDAGSEDIEEDFSESDLED